MQPPRLAAVVFVLLAAAVAEASYVSEQPYEIRFPDGRVVFSAEFLRQQPSEFDEQSGLQH